MGERGRSAGRPRDLQADDRILNAARAVLAQHGFEALNYELIGRRAGVSRPTIYRRWPSKVELAYDAAFPAADLEPITYTGDLRADLARVIAAAAQAYSRPETRAALPALLPHLMPGSSLRESARDPLATAAREQFRSLLAQAANQRELATDVDADLLFDTMIGVVLFRVAFQGEWAASTPADLVQLLMTGIARPDTQRRGRTAKRGASH